MPHQPNRASLVCVIFLLCNNHLSSSCHVRPRPGYPFNKHSEAIAACAGIGARLATRAELDYAFYQVTDSLTASGTAQQARNG